MNYKQKYEKYKHKYFLLKKQSHIPTDKTYVKLCVSGPWYPSCLSATDESDICKQFKGVKTGHAPPGTIVKYDMYKFIKYFPYIKTTPVLETFPTKTSIFVPKEKVDYVMSELQFDNYDVSIC